MNRPSRCRQNYLREFLEGDQLGGGYIELVFGFPSELLTSVIHCLIFIASLIGSRAMLMARISLSQLDKDNESTMDDFQYSGPSANIVI